MAGLFGSSLPLAWAADPDPKDLAEKVLAYIPAEEAEARKLALASDLHWLISEGNVIEFNDGSLDLPRAKAKPAEAPAAAAEVISEVQPEAAKGPGESAVLSESQPKDAPVERFAEVAHDGAIQAQRAPEENLPSNETSSSDGAGESPELPRPQEISQGEQ